MKLFVHRKGFSTTTEMSRADIVHPSFNVKQKQTPPKRTQQSYPILFDFQRGNAQGTTKKKPKYAPFASNNSFISINKNPTNKTSNGGSNSKRYHQISCKFIRRVWVKMSNLTGIDSKRNSIYEQDGQNCKHFGYERNCRFERLFQIIIWFFRKQIVQFRIILYIIDKEDAINDGKDTNGCDKHKIDCRRKESQSKSSDQSSTDVTQTIDCAKNTKQSSLFILLIIKDTHKMDISSLTYPQNPSSRTSYRSSQTTDCILQSS